MKNLPPRALNRAVAVLMRQMERRRPRLFRRLSNMDEAVILIEPVDLPHRFVLRLGGKGVGLDLVESEPGAATARIKGKLESLLDMLEGRSDGDALFFSRDLVITGDTSAIVALRNILDGEDIEVVADVLSIAGPFARPAGAFLRAAERAVAHIRDRLASFHETLHMTGSSGADVAAECRHLRDEVQSLRARLAKLEAQRKLAARKAA